ncbi:MAG TPA: hypothetical protein VN695_11715 [Streptosporangiaceae bacterium]|nr:hypothetical protein [Streptosporangiaceae bacterium]
MTIRFARTRTAVFTLCATTAIATVAAGTAAAATGHPARHHGPAAATSLPVVIDCAMKHHVKPSGYILACGDGSAFLARIHWAAWGGQAAFGNGTESLRICKPNCAEGKTVTFPVLIALWRVQPLPGHRSVRYFTRVTLIYTGNRTYKVGGKKFRQPQTVTDPLSNFGGAG